MMCEKVPIQDHTLHNIREFTNFSISNVIPNILEKLFKKIYGMERDFLFFVWFYSNTLLTTHSVLIIP